MQRFAKVITAVASVLVACQCAVADLQVATFTADVTPPIGSPLCGGRITPVVAVDDPLLAKGVILRDEGGTYVLCAVDWCLLAGKAYDSFREKIAAAAGTDVSHVAVQTVHPHNAPWIDPRAQELMAAAKDAPVHADLTFLDASIAKVAAAVKAATDFQPVTEVGTSKAIVEHVASNRRVTKPDGTTVPRYSAGGKDPFMREAPEGLIDPYVRTVTLFSGDKEIAQLHYYASHPMSYYGDGRVTSDFSGLARERLQKDTGVFQVYFNGCAGNITAGKYNAGTPEDRKALTDRLYAGMKASIEHIDRQPVSKIAWRVRGLRLPRRTDEKGDEKVLRATLNNPTTQPGDRGLAALDLASLERLASDRPVELNCLAMGSVRILNLPGEPFIEYQLLAQQLRSDSFVAVAGYGDDFTGYLCTEKAYTDGGYEPTATVLGPMNEGYFRAAITDLLADRVPPTPKLKDVRRIWDAAPHCAFTDLVRYKDRWFCTFRESQQHVAVEGNVRVISSADGDTWESAALFTEPQADLRDPKLSITPDGRLMLLGGRRTWPPHAVTLQSWVAFSNDGTTWTERQKVLDEGLWLWRVTWNGDATYGIAYGGEDPQDKKLPGWTSELVKSTDGVHYEDLAHFASYPGMTEAALQFDASGKMYCVHRRDAGTRTALLGTSEPPYSQWTWRDSGFFLGGPALIFHKGCWWTAGRWMVGPAKTVLARVDFDKGTIEPVLSFPSAGDNSYPGLVVNGDDLWMSYYSSHEGKKTSIYLARIAFE